MPGRTHAIKTKLATQLHDEANRHHRVTKVDEGGWDQPATFRVAILDHEDQPTGHFATVTVAVTRSDDELRLLRAEIAGERQQ